MNISSGEWKVYSSKDASHYRAVEVSPANYAVVLAKGSTIEVEVKDNSVLFSCNSITLVEEGQSKKEAFTTAVACNLMTDNICQGDVFLITANCNTENYPYDHEEIDEKTVRTLDP